MTRYLVTVDEETGEIRSCQRLGPTGELIDAPLPGFVPLPGGAASAKRAPCTNDVPAGVSRAPGTGVSLGAIPAGVSRAPGSGVTLGKEAPAPAAS